MKWCLLISLCVLYMQCEKEERIEEQEFKAEVLGGDCGVDLLDFKTDLNKVAAISQVSGWPSYRSLNLDEQYRKLGQKLFVRIRKPKDRETIFCNTLSLGYPLIIVTSARPVE